LADAYLERYALGVPPFEINFSRVTLPAVSGTLSFHGSSMETAMGKLILEFQLGDEVLKLDNGTVFVELGNGVGLKTTVPAWVEGIRHAHLTLTLDVDGEPARS
jgi:hypothetical protein